MADCPYRTCRITGKCIYPDRSVELGCPKDPKLSDEEYGLKETLQRMEEGDKFRAEYLGEWCYIDEEGNSHPYSTTTPEDMKELLKRGYELQDKLLPRIRKMWRL